MKTASTDSDQASNRHDRIVHFVNTYYIVYLSEILAIGGFIGLGFNLGPTVFWKIVIATVLTASYHYFLIHIDRILRPKR